jgi:hypothetical protein
MNQEILKVIKEKRPTISDSSLKTYESIIRNLYKKVFNDDLYDLNKFNTESDKVLAFLNETSSNKRKTILSALVVITHNINYRDKMIEDIKEYNKIEAKQEKTEKQKDNWVETDEINNLKNKLEKVSNLLYKKEFKTPSDYQEIQNYILICLYGGIYMPPRRSLDYVNMKIKNVNTNTDNYINRGTFIFNTYKTAKSYGQQKVKIPIKLKAILNKWIKINPTEHLLFDIAYGPLSNIKLTQRLNKIFDKKASVNQMRKTYLSSKYSSSIDTKKELEEDFKIMGSSVLQENIYIKK